MTGIDANIANFTGSVLIDKRAILPVLAKILILQHIRFLRKIQKNRHREFLLVMMEKLSIITRVIL